MIFPDVQAALDQRDVHLEEVGTYDMRQCVAVVDRDQGKQSTVADGHMCPVVRR